MPAFVRYIGIDYSGAQTPTANLKSLRVYLAEDDAVRSVSPWLEARFDEAAKQLRQVL